jgi:hypothetical protein
MPLFLFFTNLGDVPFLILAINSFEIIALVLVDPS